MLTTTSCCGSNPDGDGDMVGVQKCGCMMQTCCLAHWRQPYVCALKVEKAAPDVLGCGSTQMNIYIYIYMYIYTYIYIFICVYARSIFPLYVCVCACTCAFVGV